MATDLAAWIDAQLTSLAASYQATIEREGQDPDVVRAQDPDGFWALHDSQRLILDAHPHEHPYPKTAPHEFGCRTCHVSTLDGSLDLNGWCDTIRALGWSLHNGAGYQEDWKP